MLRKLLKVTLSGAIGAVALVLAMSATGGAQEKGAKKDGKKLTTKQIMATGHKGAESLFSKVQGALKEKKWDAAAEPAKDLAANGSLFPKASPPRGEAKSWEELAGKYAETTKALADAVEKKDEAAAKKAAGALGGSCKACHDNHRGKK